MNKHAAVPIRSVLGALLVLCGYIAPAVAGDSSPDIEFFEKKVRPVLVEHCYKCHSSQAKKLKGGLLLDSRDGILKGGDSGPALVVGHPEKSRLIEAIHYKNVDLSMPPKGKLPDSDIADLTNWVKIGAPWPKGDALKPEVKAKPEFDLARRKQEHWCWQPIQPRQPPAVKDLHWPRHPVDAFILSRLEEKGLAPAPAADKRTLIRRIYFDLIGLPPAPDEVETFLQDTAPEAFAKLVDRLLASPHFGERWGRHWLDLVRYAETRGHEFDYLTPNAYQYRDYVIRAFNADVPYNRFVTEHIAGDLLDGPRLNPAEGFNESILGTGFWFLGEEVHSPVDIRQDEADRFDNKIDVLCKTFLGLTVSCARCHDHKFDAISTKDYYALAGFLQSSSFRLARFDSLEQNRKIAREVEALRARGRGPIQRALAETVRPTLDRLADYLLAAREMVLAEPASDPKVAWAVKLDENGQRRLEKIAQERKLDAAILKRLLSYLNEAVKDADDPLHGWAKIAADPAAGDPKRCLELSRPVLEGMRKRDAEAAAGWKNLEVAVDYAKLQPGDWLPDDVTFGPAPARPGDIRWGSSPDKPIMRFCEVAAAEKDPMWDRLKLSPGAEKDQGALGNGMRPGRTISTPTFPLTSGAVYYLVKGTGSAYAAVDSHATIQGPLHGQLVKGFKTTDSFQWVKHDLSPYKGHRAHLEFTPAEGSDFALAMVVEAKQPPGSVRRANRLLVQLLEGADAGSLELLAKAYQRLFAGIDERLAGDKLIGTEDAADCARLANWLYVRGDFTDAERAREKRVAQAAAGFIDEQAKLFAQVKTTSRLALAMMEGSGEDEHVFIRGTHKAPGEVVPRRFLEALAGPDRLSSARGSGRLELARQMTDPTLNPFVTRVLVNRVWMHLFGKGIVPSADNFGKLGELPTHPELLDYIAGDFARQGWSIKKLIRALVLSNTYQMSAQPGGRGDEVDPRNELVHHMRIRRLEGETIRDAMLAISGRLDDRKYGPSVPIFLTPFLDGRGRPASGPLDGDGRRSIYLAVRRNFLAPMMLAFDTPIPFSTVGKRTVSNVPAQSLILLNDPFVHQQAELWAKRELARKASTDERIAHMYQSAFARPPAEAELTACKDFLDRQTQLHGGTPNQPAAWTDLAHVLFNVKEFVFVQ